MTNWHYIIVGAGSAGCVLAERLSLDPANRVLLLEAGPEDKNPYIHMPRGVAKLYEDPRHMWFFQTEAHDGVPSETWLRGKTLGGSSSVNGMMYFRGQAEDYDHWESLGATGWGWDVIGPAFRAIENHELGGNKVRGDSGSLRITVERERTPLSEAFISAGEQMGLPRVEDLNWSGREGVGYVPRTIWKGRRQSSAEAFLKPARSRSNLQVLTGARVDHVRFERRRAVGVTAMVDGTLMEFRTQGEVIIAAGALMSPQILQRSGIGDAEFLQSLGIAVIAHAPGVGEHMLEHRLLVRQFEVNAPYSHNPHLRGAGLIASVLRYYLTRSGPMAVGFGTMGAFARVLHDSATPDVEILVSPAVALPDDNGRLVVDAAHSIQLFGYPLRSRSEGSIRIVSADPMQPARIRAGYLTDPYDCAVTVAMHRYISKWMEQPAIASMVVEEREPSRSLQTDDEIVAAYHQGGQAGFHACGTCRMGNFHDAVLDQRLSVKGVEGVRVVDGSIMPAMVSANTNGPIMASAWRAAALIQEGRNW